MEVEVEQTESMNQNPVLSVDKNGFILYSNKPGNLLLNEWGVKEGEKLPSIIGDLVKRVSSRNSPEKTDIKVGNCVYMIVLSPIHEQECVNISGFDISDHKELEEELQESEDKYIMIFEIIEEGISIGELVLDEKGHPRDVITLDLNHAFEKHSGIKREQILGRRITELFPITEQRWLDRYNEVVRSGRGKHFEEYNASVDRWYSVFASPMGGNRFISVFSDISKRKQAEEALKKVNEILEEKVKERTAELEKSNAKLKESEEHLADAQRMAHIGNYDWNIIANELYWSDELHSIFGLNPQEDVTYEKALNCVHPEDRYYVCNSNKEAFNGNVYGITYRIIRPNGEERVIHSEREAIFDEEKNPVRIRGTIQDITEQEKSKEKIQESERKYRNIVETANEIILITNEEEVITYVNKKIVDILGYSPEEVVGKPIWSFICKEYRPIIKLNLEKRRKGISESYETKLIRKDGSSIWIFLNATPLFDKDGKYIGVMSMLTDITQRKETEEALKKIEIARKQEIHHRIKNNLQVISSLLDLQSEQFRNRGCIEDSEVLEAFRESRDRVISMAIIHEELYRGGEFEKLNLTSYIKQLAENLFQTYRLGNADISLKIDIAENSCFDMDTAVPLGIIVNELVSNSFKHAFSSRDKGEIQIKLHREECYNTNYILSVSDNGIGIPENLDIKNLESLGLQLVTTLAEQLDGKIELKTDNGTEFIIKFNDRENNDQEPEPAQLQLIDND